MKDFAAIDFETANHQPSSICSVGLVVVRNGEIVDRYYSLIQPEPNYYSYWCTRVHGLTQEDTEEAEIFPKVWANIEPRLVLTPEEQEMLGKTRIPLVAHNKSFDENCLKSVFRVYQMDYPEYEFHCTCKASRKVWPEGHHNLDIIAERCGYNLKNHHNALADAEACAWIAQKIL